MHEALEPFKTDEFQHQRGVPVLHPELGKYRNISINRYFPELDCSTNTEDPQCQHIVMAASPMLGAGHHVRAKTNTPIIGILTQPIPEKAP